MRLNESVLVVGLCRVNIPRLGHDIVVAGQNDRQARRVKLFCMRYEAVAPAELVVEFRPGLWVAIWCIEGSNDNSSNRRLDVAALCIRRIARKLGPGENRFGIAREDGDAVPRRLPAPNGAIACRLD